MKNTSATTWAINNENASTIMWLFEVGNENILAITSLIKMSLNFPEITWLNKRGSEKPFSIHVVNLKMRSECSRDHVAD